MLASQMTGGLLRKRLRAMSPSSMGLDGWSLQDLQLQVDSALDWLAQLLQLVEDTGKWPGVLAERYMSLIPKPGEEGPMGTRPLTVLSMVYRLWARTWLRDVLLRQEAWAQPEAYSFRPCRGAIDGVGVTAVLSELAQLKKWNLAGLSPDYVKCFDIIPQALVLRVAREPGINMARCGPWPPWTGSCGAPSGWRATRGSGGGPPTASCGDAPSA